MTTDGPESGESELAPDSVASGPGARWRSLVDDRGFLRRLASTIVVVGCTVFTLVQVHIEKVFLNNTPTGGDMGAHVWAPAFLRDHLLPNFRLQGWSMDWYAGLPVYRFYMLPPALLMSILNGLGHIPYGIAFKFVAILGVATMPLNAWLFGRLSRMPWPVPEFLTIGALLFIFDENFSIYGGNIASNMAGEFSFAIALSLAVLGFGLLTRGLREGRGLGAAAAVLALSAVCHGIVAIFVALGAVTMVIIWLDRRRWKWSLATLVTLGLLVAWWILPFKLSTHFMTNMKYEPYQGPWWKFFNPQSTLTTWFLILFAVVGFVASLIRRNRAGVFLGITCVSWVALVIAAHKPLPIVGDLFWNYRGLPFFYLMRYLLAVIGIAEAAMFLAHLPAHVERARDRWEAARRSATASAPDQSGSPVESILESPIGLPIVTLSEADDETAGSAAPIDHEGSERRRFWVELVTLIVVGVVSLGWVAFAIDRLPYEHQEYIKGKWTHVWGPIKGPVVNDGVDSDGWANYNFSGYQGRETWNEYRALMKASNELGADRGCGRALWEHQSDKYGNYGTPMALMLLPFWTDGCIGSMEGLFFEASGTTPYHFLTASAASENASDPVRQLRYDKNKLTLGVRYMRELGVRYYYAFTPDMVAQAAKIPDLTEVKRSGPWRIYEIKDWALVVPIEIQPIVAKPRGGDARERWLEVGLTQFQHPDEWKARIVDSGPREWQRVTLVPDEARRSRDRVDYITTRDQYAARPEPSFSIDASKVRLEQSSISFDVPKEAIGHPVLVRVSFFPNWKAHGAKGPYRTTPNFMVVVPTSTHVKLTYGYTALDLGSYALTFIGLVGLVVFWRGRRVDFSKPAGDSDPEPESPESSGPREAGESPALPGEASG